jgi:hypothetical protein
MLYIIRNVDSVPHTYAGMEIAASDQYEIQSQELSRWANDSLLLTHIATGIAVVNDGSSDITDISRAINYLKDIPNLDSDGYPIIRTRAFNNTDGYLFRGVGVIGEAVANSVSNIDYRLTEERWINEAQLILMNHNFTDSIKFQVVDVDNVLGYGAGLVLNEFATNWQISSSKQDQGTVRVDYPARILANLYIRIVYTNTGNSTVSVKCNFFLHKKT